MDLMGEEREIELPGFDAGYDAERFRDKTQQFLKAHENDPVIHKLRWNEPLTREDLDGLQVIMAQSGTESLGGLKKVRSNGQLGLFVRSLVGLDREAAKGAFAGFLDGKKLTANQSVRQSRDRVFDPSGMDERGQTLRNSVHRLQP